MSAAAVRSNILSVRLVADFVMVIGCMLVFGTIGSSDGLYSVLSIPVFLAVGSVVRSFGVHLFNNVRNHDFHWVWGPTV